MTQRIVLVHALLQSIEPINRAFARLWGQAQLSNLLDDSLSIDLLRAGRLGPAMIDRFITLGRYAAKTKPTGILFTCSAFGPCIDACARDLTPLPVLKPNEAMVEEVAALGGRVGLLATFAPTLATMPAELCEAAPGVEIAPLMVNGALAALARGEGEEHDRLVAAAAVKLGKCTAIALAQFSMARAAAAVAHATGERVLTAPDSAVRKLKRIVVGDGPSGSEAAPVG